MGGKDVKLILNVMQATGAGGRLKFALCDAFGLTPEDVAISAAGANEHGAENYTLVVEDVPKDQPDGIVFSNHFSAKAIAKHVHKKLGGAANESPQPYAGQDSDFLVTNEKEASNDPNLFHPDTLQYRFNFANYDNLMHAISMCMPEPPDNQPPQQVALALGLTRDGHTVSVPVVSKG